MEKFYNENYDRLVDPPGSKSRDRPAESSGVSYPRSQSPRELATGDMAGVRKWRNCRNKADLEREGGDTGQEHVLH